MSGYNKEILEKPYPTLTIKQSTIDAISKHPKFYRGHVRTATGKLYTTEEFKKRSDNVLGKEMP